MSKSRTALVWLALVVVALSAICLMDDTPNPDRILTLDDLAADLDQQNVAEVWFESNQVIVERWSGETYRAVGQLDESQYAQLYEQGVMLNWEGRGSGWLESLAWLILPLLILALVVVVVLRRMGGQQAQVMTLQKTRAKRVEEASGVRFDDVGGAREAKDALRDVIDYLVAPQEWEAAGARLPRGVLLEGPPGCGKTLLARAVAGEAGVPFFVVSASEFVEMFVGVGAARVRDTFEEAQKVAPAVVFIDEIDAVGRRRGSGVGSGHDEREQTLNQLLVCMDGFDQHSRVVVVGATNRADILDQALLRPGRFDLKLSLARPDEADRRETLAIHARNKAMAEDVDLDDLARQTEGRTGADLEHVCNGAALAAVRRARSAGGTPRIQHQDLLDALAAQQTERQLDQLDKVLVESAAQLVQPETPLAVFVRLNDGRELAGSLVYADAAFLKIRSDDGQEWVMPKLSVSTLRAAEALAPAGAIQEDGWSTAEPGTA